MRGWSSVKQTTIKSFATKATKAFRQLRLRANIRSESVTEAMSSDQAVVRSLPEASNISIAIMLAGEQRHMSRPKDEPLAKTLGRIQMNAVPKAKKAKKGKNRAASPARPAIDLEVELFSGGPTDREAIPKETLNQEAWVNASLLRVGETSYEIIVNPPTLEKVFTHGQPMLGHPICPIPEVNFAEEGDCLWQWSRKSKKPGAWEEIQGADMRVYVPGPEDLGAHLQVKCAPSRPRDGTETHLLGGSLTTELGPVRAGPPLQAGAHRHKLTPEPLRPPGVRVVTYNILADQYVGTAYAQEVLFADCPPEFRAAEYRRPLVLQEILGFNADIICLQEVDEKAFQQFLQPHLDYAGFEGSFTNKAGPKQREGSATFFRRSHYRSVASAVVRLNDLVSAVLEHDEPSSPHGQLLPILKSSQSLVDHLQKVSTVAQLTILAPVNPTASNQPLCVANTHLFYHPRANHIRSLHTAAILAEAHRLTETTFADAALSGLLGGRRPALLFCGDLNSGLNKGIPGNLELLATGRLPGDYWDWEAGRTFKFVKEHEDTTEAEAGPEEPPELNSSSTSNPAPASDPTPAPAGRVPFVDDESLEMNPWGRRIYNPEFQGAELRVPYQLAPADGFKTPYTNYVKGYQGGLDYVFYERERMSVRREIPLPSEAELAGWIPNERFPSDHMSVVFDLEWREVSDEVSPVEAPSAAARVFPADASHLVHGLVAFNIGGVVAVPTDTLYGLAAGAEISEGVNNLYGIKQRSRNLPVAICVAEVAWISRYAETDHLPAPLLEELLPGPVTLLLRRKADSPLAPELNAGMDTIGIRIPDSPFVQQLCSAFRSAIALTSANPSGGDNSLEVDDFRELWCQCGAVYDGGRIPASPLGSTIVNLTVPGRYSITRAGVAEEATREMLERHGLRDSGLLAGAQVESRQRQAS